jgi:hypothetical protein
MGYTDLRSKKLQRAIADARGIPFTSLVGTASQEAPSESGRTFEPGSAGSLETERPAGPPPETKRKYRRHPKPDENAPERPPSAYVIFSNRIREEVKDLNLSFTQIAKLVGDRWQKLDPLGKEPFEAQASAAKERYNVQLAGYRKTEEYREYMAYLADFKLKHGQPSEAKRPKLEPESSGSIVSTRSAEVSQEGTVPTLGHFRGGSIGSSASSPFISGSTQPSSSGGPVPPRPPLPSSRSDTPPPTQQGRDYLRTGGISGPSSVSDESSAFRSEVPETVNRTANLSIAGASATPPLPNPQQSPAPPESVVPHDPLARSRLSYFIQQQGPPPLPLVGATQPGPGSMFVHQNLPSPTAREPSWRSRSTDLRGYPELSRALPSSHSLPSPGREQLSPTQLPPMFSPERPPEYHHASSSRSLPPPHASSSGTTTLPHLGRAMEQPQPLTAEALRARQQGHEDNQPGLARSESDAANALAGLASGPPRPEGGPPPRPAR